MRQLLAFVTTLSCSLSICLVSSCSKTPEPVKIEGFAQGTTYHFTFVLADQTQQAAIQQDVTTELQRIDASISNYRKDSTIELFNAQLDTEVHEVNEEVVQLVEQARKISIASNGCYDLTVKPLFDLWGFKKDSFNLPSDDALQQTLQVIGIDKVITADTNHLQKTLPNLRVDLSSIGQGHSVGRIADLLEKHGVTNYLVEIGGELKARGKKPDGKPWRVALEKPLPNERKLSKIVAFNAGEPMSLMASGTYRHYFDSNGKRYSHILDARTGKPVEHNTVSVAVLHPNPAIADAWSTALLCLGSEAGIKAANENNIAALYVDQQGEQLIEHKSKALNEIKGIELKEAEDN
ncbi:MAG TPA: FAD:protein FMN transferase [Cellvibrio sp.]|nr:FAD:protein FMN transferase [Cellvibrio sp.]